MLRKDELRAFCEFAAFTWLIGMLYHAGDGDIHNGLRRVYAHYVRLHQQRRSDERLIPARLPDGVEWRTRAMHAAIRAVVEPPYRDAMGMMLTRLFQSPGNRLGETDVPEPRRGEVRLHRPGQSALARRMSAAVVQNAGLLLGAGEARVNRRDPVSSTGNRLSETDVPVLRRREMRLYRPGQNAVARRLSAAAVQNAGSMLGAGEDRVNRRDPAAAIDLTESNDSESGELGAGTARVPRAEIAPESQGDPPSIELSDSNLQRIDASVDEFRATDGKQK